MARSRMVLTVGALSVAAFALAASTSVTGAYFNEAKGGTITGTLGQVHLEVAPSSIAFTNMLPGEPQTATVGFTNTGTVPQDFYVVFNNGPALHALNNLGSYGEVHLKGGPTYHSVPLFDSVNLQDGRTKADLSISCGNFVPTGCWPLNKSYKLASSVPVSGTGSFSFTFNYPGKLGNKSNVAGAVFNHYPSITTESTPGSQAYGADADGVTPGDGLPYQIIATQVGHSPTE